MICSIHIRKGNTNIGFTGKQMLIDYTKTFLVNKPMDFDVAISLWEKEGWNVTYGKAN